MNVNMPNPFMVFLNICDKIHEIHEREFHTVFSQLHKNLKSRNHVASGFAIEIFGAFICENLLCY